MGSMNMLAADPDRRLRLPPARERPLTGDSLEELRGLAPTLGVLSSAGQEVWVPLPGPDWSSHS